MTTCKHLTMAQRQRMNVLCAQMQAAERQAQEFLAYLCDEHGVELGRDGWQFDLEKLVFVQDEEACPDKGGKEVCRVPSET